MAARTRIASVTRSGVERDALIVQRLGEPIWRRERGRQPPLCSAVATPRRRGMPTTALPPEAERAARTERGAPADPRRILLTRGLRGFADGFVSVLLADYLSRIGFS